MCVAETQLRQVEVKMTVDPSVQKILDIVSEDPSRTLLLGLLIRW